MSGLEVLGAAASLIQIADAGLKLYNYIDSIASANKRITRVAKNLETTCNVVKEIGEVFQRQETARLVSKSAVKMAQDAAEECNSMFGELREAVGKSGGNRFGFPFREGRLEVLSLQLEKLKSSLLLLMALLIHARVLVDGDLGRESEERKEIRRLIVARDADLIRFEELRRSHDLLIANLLPSTSVPVAPLSNTFVVNTSGPTAPGQPGIRSPNDDDASELVPFGQRRSDTVDTLDITIRQVSELLERLKAIKDAIDDTAAFSRAKKTAGIVYQDLRTPLDDLLLSGEFTPPEHGSSLEGSLDADSVTRTLSSEAKFNAKEEIRKSRQQKEKAEQMEGKAVSTEVRSHGAQDSKKNSLLGMRRSLENATETTRHQERENRAMAEQLSRIETHLDTVLDRKRVALENAPDRTTSTPHVYTKIHTSHLDIRTLQRFKLPFEIDPIDALYLLVLEEMDREETDALFEHTRVLRLLVGDVPPLLGHVADLRVGERGRRVGDGSAFEERRRRLVIEEDEGDGDGVDELLREWTTLMP
ncbi:hypothetical protein EG327_006223 [Venturia inaequalis]|uniref:Fungal N-terminal domain-containing protein n=1 Tax=Venturia inaequalis TaxID=5025 RepID=A0A8H3Z0S9_VENIN|nr:hypothetical protein EG327_006223 [Venturia inaequalis]